MHSISEENYLKAIYTLTKFKEAANTNDIAELLGAKASSVTDMIKKLSQKELINYTKYYGATLTENGKKTALIIVRKHRLWETFLHKKLDFNWDEVHEIAEELEHVSSTELINRLDKFLGFPKFDPHGDPIPNKEGEVNPHKNFFINDLKVGDRAIITGIKDSSVEFLRYLERIKLVLGAEIQVIDKMEFDNSMAIKINEKKVLNISNHISANIFIKAIEQ